MKAKLKAQVQLSEGKNNDLMDKEEQNIDTISKQAIIQNLKHVKHKHDIIKGKDPNPGHRKQNTEWL